MRILFIALMVVMSAGAAQAQTFGDVTIELGAYWSSPDGGEKPVGVWFGTGPVVIGKQATAFFSSGEACEAFAVSADGSTTDDPTAAWKIDVTPIRVARDAVTFRLRWRMASYSSQGGRLTFSESAPPPAQDMELTLRPGESWTVHRVRPRSISRYACMTESSIRVSVDHYPSEERERRLVVADLWLVERLANGSEAQHGQPLSVRGLPNRPLQYFFDTVTDGNAAIEVYGTLTARPGSGAIAVTVETRSRWGGSSKAQPPRFVKSTLDVKPSETVEIRLPTFADDAGAFARRAFSIRIRARQLR
jgi:hypothetical protein